jgi:hypothetical protein
VQFRPHSALRAGLNGQAGLQRRAHARAAKLGVSFAEYVRRLIRDDVGATERKTDVSAIFDPGDSGGTDISQHKRRLAGDAIAARKLKR